jgi:hypothetical protein
MMRPHCPTTFDITSTIGMRWFWAPLKNFRSLQFSSSHVQYTYEKPGYIGDSQRSSGLWRVISDACHRSCLTIRRYYLLNVSGPFERYSGHRRPAPGTTSWLWMSHGSITLEIMNVYGCLLMKKFRIGTCHGSVQKVMLAIVWDSTEFAVATPLESGCKFNAGYYVSEVLTPLSEWWRERGGGNFRKLIVHADNARPHKAIVSQQSMARNAMIIAAHPPYSPDLAPSDFYLLGHVRGLLGEGHSRLGSECHRRSRAFSGPSKSELWRRFFSSGWRDPSDMARSMIDLKR